MATTYEELMTEVRARTKQLSLEALRRRLAAGEALTLLDVREREETAAGHIPGAVCIPRGLLELQVESRIPDKSGPIVVYCAAGTRSALAAATLADLGYSRVETANPGFSRWRELQFPIVIPRALTPGQRDRYSRHLLLPEVGEEGQLKLLSSKVLLLGAGGLGSPAALYLAAAGIGLLGIVDSDVVDASNLQRQVLHATSRIGRQKVVSAAETLADLNSDVKVVPHGERLTRDNVDRLFEPYDIVVDGTDNFPTRYLVNDAAVAHGKPVVHGSIFRFDGQVTTFMPPAAALRLGTDAGPCYRCLYPEPPPPHLAPNCQEAGVLGVLCGIVGTLQATEVIKLVLGRGASLAGRLLTYDSLQMRFRELKIRRDANCPVCSSSATIHSYPDYEDFCAAR